jgi:hypothetical protein
VSAFSADWLALRGGYDRAARSRPLAQAFLAGVPAGAPIVDLGAATGANATWLRELDSEGHRWRLVDLDPALLSASPLADIERVTLDLAQALEPALDAAAAVTASALLDLVSPAWLERLADMLAARRLPALFALTYDGRMRWTPLDRDDPLVRLDFHLDMRRDKGFGTALGPDAVDASVDALARRRARVRRANSDWRIAAGDDAMLATMIDGIAGPAAAAAPADAARIRGWAERRHLARRAGTLSVEIGHQDVYASFP